MIWAIIILSVLLAVLGLLLWAVWPRKQTVTGGPTPEEAKIDNDAASLAQKVAIIAEKGKGGLQGESADDLVQRIRDRISGVRK